MPPFPVWLFIYTMMNSVSVNLAGYSESSYSIHCFLHFQQLLTSVMFLNRIPLNNWLHYWEWRAFQHSSTNNALIQIASEHSNVAVVTEFNHIFNIYFLQNFLIGKVRLIIFYHVHRSDYEDFLRDLSRHLCQHFAARVNTYLASVIQVWMYDTWLPIKLKTFHSWLDTCYSGIWCTLAGHSGKFHILRQLHVVTIRRSTLTGSLFLPGLIFVVLQQH